MILSLFSHFLKPKYDFLKYKKVYGSNSQEYKKMTKYLDVCKRHYSNKEETPLFLNEEEFDKKISLLDKLKYINTFVNTHIKYKRATFDYWKTPYETIISGEGDCEDLAILKMYLVKKYLDKHYYTEFLLVKDTYKNEYHALAVINDYVLDNQTNYITLLKNGSNRYKPIYKINKYNLFLY